MVRESVTKRPLLVPSPQIMDMSGNSSNETSDSDDSFDESNRCYEDIILRVGQHGTEASGANGWEYGAYSERGSQFSGNLPTVSFLMVLFLWDSILPIC